MVVTVSVTWPAARAARVEIGQGLGVGLYELGCSPQLRRPLPLFSSRIVLYSTSCITFASVLDSDTTVSWGSKDGCSSENSGLVEV